MEDVAILCEACLDNGNWETMWPGKWHDKDPSWGVAEIETDDNGEWVVNWLATGLTVAQAEAHLDGLDFDGPLHLMG